MGLWFHDLRRALQGFFQETQRLVTGEVRLKLYKGSCAVLGRRSPHSLYDSRLANQSNLELFDNQWARVSRRCGRCPRAWPPASKPSAPAIPAVGPLREAFGLYKAFLVRQYHRSC